MSCKTKNQFLRNQKHENNNSTIESSQYRKGRMDLPMRCSSNRNILCNIAISMVILYNNYKVF
ncbi:MAG: hypothetical protein ACTHME_00310, partial [Candidatus Nitrosocosmicus sp.]